MYLKSVPCNGCRMCCINDLVRILPSDNASLYKTEPHALYPKTQIMLAHKSNGECHYLGETGCTIQGSKPQMCREMDCRNIAKKVPKKQAKASGLLRIWLKGRSMA